jgi:hypothetical protein
MSMTLDVVIKDVFYKVLRDADAETLEKISKIAQLQPKTLGSIRKYLEDELETFYEQFLKLEEEGDEE